MREYKYPDPPALPEFDSLFRTTVTADEQEELTGEVHGQDASAPEERLAKAADVHGQVQFYEFRKVYNRPVRNMAGAIELDFLFHAGTLIPAFVDEEFFHKMATQREEDRQKANFLYERFLKAQGARRPSRIRADLLETQDMANSVVEQLVSGRIFTLDDAA